MDKKSKQQPQPEGEITLEQITKECLDSPGYVIFAGMLDRNKDSKLINFKYRRFQFSFDDTQKAIQEFNKMLQKDANS